MAITRVMNNSGDQKIFLKQKIPVHKLIGVTALQYKADIDRFTGDNTGSLPLPANTAYVRFALCDDMGASSQTVLCRIKIIYHVTWFNRVILAPST